MYQTECDTEPSNDSNLTSGSIVVNNGPFSTGTLVILSDPDVCECYRIELTYEDECESGTSVDNYYFRDGPCPESEFNGETSGLRLNSKIGILQNPVSDDVQFFIDSETSAITHSDATVRIFSSTGELIFDQVIETRKGLITVPLSQPPGNYHYAILIEGNLYSGTIVKL